MSDDDSSHVDPGQPASPKTQAAPDQHANPGSGWSAFQDFAASRGEGMHLKLLEALERDRLAAVKAMIEHHAQVRDEQAQAYERARSAAVLVRGALKADAPSIGGGSKQDGGEVVFVDFVAKTATRVKA